MSSNLGMRRVGLLARYCDQVCLCFDTDANDAGKLGMLKTLSELWSVKFGNDLSDADLDAPYRNVSVIRMPEGVDPDEFVMKNGLDGFLALERPMTKRLMMAAEAACEGLKERMRMKNKRREA
jgi:DNA primase